MGQSYGRNTNIVTKIVVRLNKAVSSCQQYQQIYCQCVCFYWAPVSWSIQFNFRFLFNLTIFSPFSFRFSMHPEKKASDWQLCLYKQIMVCLLVFFQMTKSRTKKKSATTHTHIAWMFLISHKRSLSVRLIQRVYFFLSSFHSFIVLFVYLLLCYAHIRKLPAKMCNHENTHWIILNSFRQWM